MVKVNAVWHDAHPMPKGATLDQRIAWHVEHAKSCGCRDVPSGIKAEMERRGEPVPRRKETL
jgi:hypothetical protein